MLIQKLTMYEIICTLYLFVVLSIFIDVGPQSDLVVISIPFALHYVGLVIFNNFIIFKQSKTVLVQG